MKYILYFSITSLILATIMSILVVGIHTGPVNREPIMVINAYAYYVSWGVAIGMFFDLLFFLLRKINKNFNFTMSYQEGALVGFIISVLGSISINYFQELAAIAVIPITLTFLIIEKTAVWVYLLHTFVYTLTGLLLGLLADGVRWLKNKKLKS